MKSVCVRNNAPTAKIKSSGSAQTKAERKASIETQNQRHMQAVIQSSCADIAALVTLTPITQ